MSQIKILVVEDEMVIADHICQTLELIGYEVLEPAINYTGALATIEEEQPDLCLLDIQLAGSKDGVDLAKKINEDYQIPFIFLTSNADPVTLERVKEVNPSAYLVKPFNQKDLYTSIELAWYNYSRNQAATADATKTPDSEEIESDLIIKNAFFIRSKSYYHKVKFETIVYLQSDHVYTKVITQENQRVSHSGQHEQYHRTTPFQFLPRPPKLYRQSRFSRCHQFYKHRLGRA